MVNQILSKKGIGLFLVRAIVVCFCILSCARLNFANATDVQIASETIDLQSDAWIHRGSSPDEWQTQDTATHAYSTPFFMPLNLPLDLGSYWNTLFSTGGTNISFGVFLSGAAPSELMFSKNEKTFYYPASVSKLFTAALALQKWGPDYRFETRFNWQNTATPGAVIGLEMVGFGDPSTGLPEVGDLTLQTRFDKMAELLWNSGIRTVWGELKIRDNDPRWAKQKYPQGWSVGDYGECYGAIGGAFNLDINCARFTITGATSGRWNDPALKSPVKVLLTQPSSIAVSVQPVIKEGYLTGEINLVGGWSYSARTLEVALPVLDTHIWFKNRLIASMRQKGISFADTPDQTPGVSLGTASLFSAPLSQILKPFLKQSLNVVGDALLRALGSQFGPADAPDLLSAGQFLMADYIQHVGELSFKNKNPGLDFVAFTGSQIVDGAGLSRQSWVSPEFLLALLNDLVLTSSFEAIWESLPIAGVDGTLAGRMGGSAAAGKLRAKTGTLTGAYNLAGYIPNPVDKKQFLPFAVLTKTTGAYRSTARSVQDQAGGRWAQALGY